MDLNGLFSTINNGISQATTTISNIYASQAQLATIRAQNAAALLKVQQQNAPAYTPVPSSAGGGGAGISGTAIALGVGALLLVGLVAMRRR